MSTRNQRRRRAKAKRDAILIALAKADRRAQALSTLRTKPSQAERDNRYWRKARSSTLFIPLRGHEIAVK